jgi:uncharacterized membrane protein YtjA (UPF0391 family)
MGHAATRRAGASDGTPTAQPSGMLAWAVLFFVLSMVVAILGGAAVAAGTAVLAQVVFYTLITVVGLGLLGALFGGGMI